MPKHRLRTGEITRLGLSQQRMRRQELTYFSIVRRRACWASFVNLSTSVRRTTLYMGRALSPPEPLPAAALEPPPKRSEPSAERDINGLDEAISLTTS